MGRERERESGSFIKVSVSDYYWGVGSFGGSMGARHRKVKKAPIRFRREVKQQTTTVSHSWKRKHLKPHLYTLARTMSIRSK